MCRASPEQRRPMRLLVYSLAVGLSGYLLDMVLRAAHVPGNSGWLNVLTVLYVLVLSMVPAAIVLGVLRYRLFDIDLVIRRSVVYGGLTLGIAGVYIGLAGAPRLALGH